MDEAAAFRIITASGHQPGVCYGKRGCSYIKQKVRDFNRTAQSIHYLALVDLMDTKLSCPPEVVAQWIPYRQPKMIFRVVVRELESWLLADRASIAKFLGVSLAIIPDSPELLSDPKQSLINLARKSRKAKVRDALVPEEGSTSPVGRLYVSEVINFIRNHWDVQEARQCSLSLDKCLSRLEALGKAD